MLYRTTLVGNTIYHRKRLGHGLQFCPRCLAEDSEPYYRRLWRVALCTFCPIHKVPLADRCPECGNGIAFQRIELGRPDVIEVKSLATCWQCGFDLRSTSIVSDGTVAVGMNRIWQDTLGQLGGLATTKISALPGQLAVLHHMCMLMTSVRLAPKLQAYLCAQVDVEFQGLKRGRFVFEQRAVIERHYVLTLAWRFLTNWPQELRKAWQSKAIRYNVLMKDFDDAPSFYIKQVKKIGGIARFSRFSAAFKQQKEPYPIDRGDRNRYHSDYLKVG